MDIRTKVYEMVSMSNVDTIIDGKFINDLFNLFIGFGYIPTKDDIFNISFSIVKVDSNIKNYCNITSIPNQIYPTILELCFCETLSMLYSSGKLDETLGLNDAVKTVNIGDTSVTFDNSTTASEQVNNLIVDLMQKAERSILCYRKLRW